MRLHIENHGHDPRQVDFVAVIGVRQAWPADFISRL
jgi:hypothetical protein